MGLLNGKPMVDLNQKMCVNTMGSNSQKKHCLACCWGSCCFKGVLAQLALMNVIMLGVAQFIHDYGKRVLLKRKWEGLGLHTSCSHVSSQHAPTPPLL